MQAEVEFLRYANLVAPSWVPELIAIDSVHRCVVLEHIQGGTYPEGVTAPKEDVQTALSFFRELNVNLQAARSMINMDASEGFLSLRQHMRNVYERIAAMGSAHLPIECKDGADEKLVELREQATRVEARLEAQIASGRVDDELDPDLRCVSPSDFGFHNAIKTHHGVRFIDFEFAGWDDPAKVAADFLLQPRIPVSKTLRLDFPGWLQEQTRETNPRLNALQPVLRLKWACIILGMLRPERLESMLQVNKDMDTGRLINERLAFVRPYLIEL